MRKTTVTVSWFSAGVSSAVATWMMTEQLDHIIYNHIDDQHPDTIRFLKDCESWFGKPITILRSQHGSVDRACRSAAFIKSPRGAKCTELLKRRPRREWEIDHEWFNSFRYVWGYDIDEVSRAERLRDAMPEHEHVFPLIDKGITKEEAHGILSAAGINRPAMYDLGYRNNNCIGCVKGGKGYWNKIRVDFPSVFADRSKLERDIGATCINGTYLDELDPKSGRDEGPVVEECGAMCEMMTSPHGGAGKGEG